jgi:hypothetical protein
MEGRKVKKNENQEILNSLLTIKKNENEQN